MAIAPERPSPYTTIPATSEEERLFTPLADTLISPEESITEIQRQKLRNSTIAKMYSDTEIKVAKQNALAHEKQMAGLRMKQTDYLIFPEEPLFLSREESENLLSKVTEEAIREIIERAEGRETEPSAPVPTDTFMWDQLRPLLRELPTDKRVEIERMFREQNTVNDDWYYELINKINQELKGVSPVIPTQAPSPTPPPAEQPPQPLDDLPIAESVTSTWPPPPSPVEEPPAKGKILFKIGDRLPVREIPVAEKVEPDQTSAQSAPQVEAAPQPETSPTPEQPIQEIYPHLPIGKISPEILRDPDVVEILQTYDQVYGLYMAKDERDLTPEQRTARAMVQDKLKKIFASGKTIVHRNRYPITWPDGSISKVTFAEYLPVDDMLAFLTEEILILKNRKQDPQLLHEADSIQRSIDTYKIMQDKLTSIKQAVDERLIKGHPKPRFTDRVKQEAKLLLQFGPRYGLNLTEKEAETLANDRINKRKDIKLFPKPKRQPPRSPAAQPPTASPAEPEGPAVEAPSTVVEETQQQGIEPQAAEVILHDVEGYLQQHGFYYEQDIPLEEQVGLRVVDSHVEARLSDGRVLQLQKDNFVAEGENFRLDNLSDELKEIFADPQNAELMLAIQIAIMEARDKISGLKEILPEKPTPPVVPSQPESTSAPQAAAPVATPVPEPL